jgi:hypothetical protein
VPLPAQLRFLAALSDPQQASTWTLAEWQLAVHQGRRLRLLARLARALEAADLLGQVPEQPLRHLRAELHLSRWRTAALSWTQEQVGEALRPLGARAVLLKGAAYLAQELPNAPGRLPSDLDILLPREQLARAAELLQRAGWREKDLDEHDRRYYLEWSHELPPMHHPVLPLELDVHHNILPATRRLRIDAARSGLSATDPGRCWRRRISCCTVPRTCSSTPSRATACATWSTSTRCCGTSAPCRGSTRGW